MQKVRVRFPPSPTGDPHVGSLRTALFNWLFARHFGGDFILRIEDTDRERYSPGSEEKIYSSLNWLGLTADEGPLQGGEVGPYVQSQRLPVYQDHARQLVASGAAYECFCTPERLEQMRNEQQAQHLPTHYDRRCRDLTEAERQVQRAAGQSPVVRLRVPERGQCVLHDQVRGDVTFAYATVDDAVLLKSDGYPTYHLAVVVDDHLMRVTHVIRGEDWLPSIPKHLLLYEAFDWALPAFAHIPLLLGKDRSKLSKRHGAVSFQSFIDQGYLPEAMMNFLALLGWNPGGEQEIFSADELVQQFSLQRVQPSGAIFDTAKLDWMNLQHLRRLSDDDFRGRLIQFLSRSHPDIADKPVAWVQQLVQTLRERTKHFSDAEQLIAFLFRWDAPDAPLLIPKKGSMEKAVQGLRTALTSLEAVPEDGWTLTAIRHALDQAIREVGESPAVLWPVRVAVTGQRASPPVYDSVCLIGRSVALRRLAKAVEILQRNSG